MTRITRRGFLGRAAGVCVAGAGAPFLHPQLAFAADGEADHTLILLNLGGGLDGISALVPAADPNYARARRLTLVPSNRLLAVNPDFGLHPALAPIHDLWLDGCIAAVPACGTTTSTRSHFSEMATVAAGATGTAADGSGWLARHLLSSAGGAAPVLAGLSMGEVPASELRGHDGAFHIRDLGSAGFQSWRTTDRARAEQALAAAYAAVPSLAGPAGVAFEAVARLRQVDAAAIEPSQPPERWSTQAAQVAALVRSGIGVRAAVLGLWGWDTHRGQGAEEGQLARQLGRLARALDRLTNDLSDRLDRVTIVVVSEFGRRVQENQSGGTDHGRGGLALVIGRGINGGVHGVWPTLAPAALDQGDVAVATDVRSVLAEVVRNRLGNDATDLVFPGFTPTTVGVA